MNTDAIVKKVVDWFVGQTISVNKPNSDIALTFHIDEFIPSETLELSDGIYLRFNIKIKDDNEVILCSILMVNKRFFDAIESTDTKFFRYSSKFLNYSAGYLFFFEFADLNNECLENI